VREWGHTRAAWCRGVRARGTYQLESGRSIGGALYSGPLTVFWRAGAASWLLYLMKRCFRRSLALGLCILTALGA